MSITTDSPNQPQAEKISTVPKIQLNKTLIINGNNQLSTYAIKGDGSKANPYLLGNFIILLSNRSQIGIELENIDNYFILNNTLIEINSSSSGDLSNVYYPKADIQLVNVSHGTISYSDILDCWVGIDLYNSTSNYFVQNLIAGSYGIRLNASTNNIINNNIIRPNPISESGIELYKSNFNLIQNNNVEQFNNNFEIDYSNDSIFKNNIARNATWNGFAIYYSKNDIFENIVSEFNEQNGFYILKNLNTTFSYNNATENNFDGFVIRSSNETTFSNNIAYNNNGLGLRVFNSKNLSFKNNKFGKTNLPKNVIMENLPGILVLAVISTCIIAVVFHKRRIKALKLGSNQDNNPRFNHYLICPKCQKRIRINSDFCENCGLQIK